MKGHQKWKIICLISVVGIAIILFLSILTFSLGPSTTYKDDYIWMGTETTYNGWKIDILSTYKHGAKKIDGNTGIPIEEISYSLNSTNEIPLSQIRNEYDENHTVIFNDNNNNFLLISISLENLGTNN